MKILREKTSVNIAGWVLLLVALFLGTLTIYYGKFVDEADNLVVGSLLAQGSILYRDIFSHHFPLPYYWMAGIISVFGKSILTARLSVWIFEITAIGIAMKFSRFHLALGLTAFLWGILRHLYRGNMVLYNSFSGIALLVILTITLSTLLGTSRPGLGKGVVLGLFATIGILSDPLTVYAISIALLFLLTKEFKTGIAAGLTTFITLCMYGCYLIATATLNDFFRDAIIFNSQVYSHYMPANPFRFPELFEAIKSGLDILNPAWYRFNPWREIEGNFDKWIFTGFLYRFSFIAGAVGLLLQKKLRAGAFIYIFAAGVLIINQSGTWMMGFVIAALATFLAFITREGLPKTQSIGLEISYKLVGICAIAMLTWLGFRVSLDIYANRSLLNYGENFGQLEEKAKILRATACSQQDLLLADFPNGIYSYWFSGIKPVSRYIYLWPWVAEVGQTEVIKTLSTEKSQNILVFVNDIVVLEKYKSREFLYPLYNFLEENYIDIGNGGYMSPGLAKKCHTQVDWPHTAKSSMTDAKK